MRRSVIPFCVALPLLGPALVLAPVWGAPSKTLSPTLKRPAPAGSDFFEREVRPVLATHCYGCHSQHLAQGGLRVDSRAALLKGGARGSVLTPGQPEKSSLLTALQHTGAVKMPPQGKLPQKSIDALTAWVKLGAPWPEASAKGAKPAVAGTATNQHWAFRPVKKPAVPVVKNRTWGQNPVDAFILAQLERKGLQPSPLADARTLIRRATFDLTGLPPTPDEVETFVREVEAEGSFHHKDTKALRGGVKGEIAASAGTAYAKLIDRLLASPAYGERWGRYWLDVARYADTKGYVFFQDGRFPWAYTYRDYVVRAFNEDLPYNRFILEQLAADQLPLGDDRRPLAGMGFLTVGGRFMNNPHDILDDRIDVVTRGLMGLTVSCARCHDHKFDPIPTKDYYSFYSVFASSEEPLVPPTFQPTPKTEAYAAYERELNTRQSILLEFVHGKHEERARNARTRVSEYLLAANGLRNRPKMDDFMLIADGGDLNPVMLIRWQAYLEQSRSAPHPVFALWNALADLPEAEFAAKAPAVIAARATKPGNPLVARAFVERPPRTLAEAAQRYAEVLGEVDRAWQEALKAGGATPPTALPDPGREELRQVFYGPNAPPIVPLGHPSDLGLLPDRPSQAKLQELLKSVETWMMTSPEAPPRAMALEDVAVPQATRVFVRGNPNNLGDPAPRQFLRLLTSGERRPFQKGSGRLELAQAIADPKNPLTARVLVNRVWLNHFGNGLVTTPSDFGLRSDPPTHPELLDYLAARFVEDGWSIKKLHRLLMLSSTYQQVSTDRPTNRRVDPENAYLWRMNRARLDFEGMRDSLLAVSGALDRTVGGPPVDLLSTTFPARRAIYGSIDRLQLPGLLRTFDFPSPDATSAQRASTTVPQQALFLLNNGFAQEAARRLVKRPEVTGATDLPAKITALYRLAYGREAVTDEVAVARQFLGESPSEVVWNRYGQALLAANEFIFVD